MTDPGEASGPAHRRVDAPGLGRLLLEPRAVLEYAALEAAAPWLARVPDGDGHPVLVLPGFVAGDTETAALRRQLRGWGYWAHGWRQGRNLGPTPELLTGLVERLQELSERHSRKVTLIGWSLGGIYSRELARAFPDRVRAVVTLASPYRMRLSDRSTLSPIVGLLRQNFPAGDGPAWPEEDDREALAVPATSIYSRTDGIVRWHACIDRAGPLRENVEVRGSHVGLPVNPSVLYVISDRLAQTEDDWKPFDPPGSLRWMYPAAVDWDGAGRQSAAGRR